MFEDVTVDEADIGRGGEDVATELLVGVVELFVDAAVTEVLIDELF